MFSNSRTMLRILLAVLLLTSFIGYLEWGNQRQFLFQMEAFILRKMWSDPLEVIHPFTVLPLLGQLILLTTILRSRPKTGWIITGASLIGILYLLLLLIGILGGNYKIILFSLPYILIATVLSIFLYKLKNR
jgi:hypothetical protein